MSEFQKTLEKEIQILRETFENQMAKLQAIANQAAETDPVDQTCDVLKDIAISADNLAFAISQEFHKKNS